MKPIGQNKTPRRSKFGNVKQADGTGSKRESARLQSLRLLERAGHIGLLRTQVPFELLSAKRRSDGRLELGVKYVADFVYQENGRQVVEDAKGFRTPDYIIKRKLMLALHGIEIRET